MKLLELFGALLIVVLAVIVIITAIAFPGWLKPAHAPISWLIIFVIMAVMLGGIGYSASGKKNLFFAFIDPLRGKYSLGQLQLVLWTLLIISVWLTVVAVRTVLRVPDSIAVDIPGEVLALLGISATSLLTGTAIKNHKDHQRGDKPPTLDRSGLPQISRDSQGKRELRDPSESPKWTDIFMGDQEGDRHYIDIGKFQMFWFTVAAIIAYFMQVLGDMETAINAGALTDNIIEACQGGAATEMVKCYFANFNLPVPTAGLISILGLSHVAYLVNKIPDRPENQ